MHIALIRIIKSYMHILYTQFQLEGKASISKLFLK